MRRRAQGAETQQPDEPNTAREQGLPLFDWVVIAIVVASAITGAATLWYHIPTAMVRRDIYPNAREYSDAVAAVRGSLGVITAALLALAAATVGLVMQNHNARLTQRAVNTSIATNRLGVDNYKQAQDQFLATERRDQRAHESALERARDDRYTKAVEMLGSDSASVRSGGLHILHRIALESPERVRLVVDTFCSYLRQPSLAIHHLPGSTELSDASIRSESQVRRTTLSLLLQLLPQNHQEETSHPSEPAGTESSASIHLDLTGAELDDLIITGKHIESINLSDAKISGEFRITHSRISGALAWRNLSVKGGFSVDEGVILGDTLEIDQSQFEGGLLIGAHSAYRSTQPSKNTTQSVYIRRTRIHGTSILANTDVSGSLIFEGCVIDDVYSIDENVKIWHNLILRKSEIGSIWLKGVRSDAFAIEGGGTAKGSGNVGRLMIDRGDVRSLSLSGVRLQQRVDIQLTSRAEHFHITSAEFLDDALFDWPASATEQYLTWSSVEFHKGCQLRGDHQSTSACRMDKVTFKGGLEMSDLNFERLHEVSWSGSGGCNLPEGIQMTADSQRGFLLH